ALQRERSPPPERRARYHRLVAGERARVDRLARADRARPLVHRSLVASARPEDPLAHLRRARARRRAAGRGRGEHRARPPAGEGLIEEVAPGDWDALLAELGLDDAYLRREYVETAAVLDTGRVALLHVEGTVFPCSVRQWKGLH